jgi:cysteinyl-tRNA synthetase
MKYINIALLVSLSLLISGCNTKQLVLEKSTKNEKSDVKKFQQKQPTLTKKDVYRELKYVNKKLNNSTKQLKVLNKKVNIISQQDNNQKELKNRIDEHEKVLMTLMNDVINLSKGQQNLQKSNQVIYEQMEKIDTIKKRTIDVKLKKEKPKKIVKQKPKIIKKEEKDTPIKVSIQQPKPIKNTNPILSTKRFRASTFELLENSDIMDKPNGDVVENWEKGTRFTTYIKHKNWVKATGVIKNKRWNKISQDYWIKIDNLKKLR